MAPEPVSLACTSTWRRQPCCALLPGKNKELSKTIEARMEGATAMAKGGPQPAKDTALEKQVAA